MKLFETEIVDGLSEKILGKSASSIVYASEALPCKTNYMRPTHIKSLASLADADLYYVQSILVTSSWNKNDDIFDKAEVWLAKDTPEDKPTNLEHDESSIIGHITANWPITEDGLLIDIQTPIENIPDRFHILIGSVVYRSFSSEVLKERSNKLIAEIESGHKYVSMECFFTDFDYGLLNTSTNEYKILARNNTTAFLTKHLRAYGGVGQHENYKIGRVLRGITFSGKGFVDRPANPDSIIFTQANLDSPHINKNSDFIMKGVLNTKVAIPVEQIPMSLENTDTITTVQEESPQSFTEAYAMISALQNQTAILETTVQTQADIISLQQTKLETVATMHDEEVLKKQKEEEAMMHDEEILKKKEEEAMLMRKKEEEAMMKEEQAMLMRKKEEEATMTKYRQAELDKKDSATLKVQSELDHALELLAGYKEKEEKMMKQNKKMKRVADLVELGIDSRAATATVEKFDALDDDMFAAISDLLVAKMPEWLQKKIDEKKQKEEDKNTTKTAPVAALEQALDSAESQNDIGLSVGGGEENLETNTTRAELVDYVCNRLCKTLYKGE